MAGVGASMGAMGSSPERGRRRGRGGGRRCGVPLGEGGLQEGAPWGGLVLLLLFVSCCWRAAIVSVSC
jgi:hypothetical protein